MDSLRTDEGRAGGSGEGHSVLIIAKDVKATGRRQTALMALCVDIADQPRQVLVASLSDISQAVPERIFNVDSCVATRNLNGMLDDCEFHDCPRFNTTAMIMRGVVMILPGCG